MARPSEIATKAVATRLPMSDYLRFMRAATDKGMSMSDWLLVKIYADEKADEAPKRNTTPKPAPRINIRTISITDLKGEAEGSAFWDKISFECTWGEVWDGERKRGTSRDGRFSFEANEKEVYIYAN